MADGLIGQWFLVEKCKCDDQQDALKKEKNIVILEAKLNTHMPYISTSENDLY